MDYNNDYTYLYDELNKTYAAAHGWKAFVLYAVAEGQLNFFTKKMCLDKRDQRIEKKSVSHV